MNYAIQDQDLIAAALLHDTLEDTDAKASEIEEIFGKRILELVAEESEDKRENEPAKDTWEIRKQETLDRLESRADHETNILVLGDKLSNMRAMQRDWDAWGDELWKRFNQKDPAKHGWYYGPEWTRGTVPPVRSQMTVGSAFQVVLLEACSSVQFYVFSV